MEIFSIFEPIYKGVHDYLFFRLDAGLLLDTGGSLTRTNLFLAKTKRYRISSIPTVLMRRRAMNQYLWSFLADFQRARPFQRRVQMSRRLSPGPNQELLSQPIICQLLKLPQFPIIDTSFLVYDFILARILRVQWYNCQCLQPNIPRWRSGSAESC